MCSFIYGYLRSLFFVVFFLLTSIGPGRALSQESPFDRIVTKLKEEKIDSFSVLEGASVQIIVIGETHSQPKYIKLMLGLKQEANDKGDFQLYLEGYQQVRADIQTMLNLKSSAPVFGLETDVTLFVSSLALLLPEAKNEEQTRQSMVQEVPRIFDYLEKVLESYFFNPEFAKYFTKAIELDNGRLKAYFDGLSQNAKSVPRKERSSFSGEVALKLCRHARKFVRPFVMRVASEVFKDATNLKLSGEETDSFALLLGGGSYLSDSISIRYRNRVFTEFFLANFDAPELPRVVVINVGEGHRRDLVQSLSQTAKLKLIHNPIGRQIDSLGKRINMLKKMKADYSEKRLPTIPIENDIEYLENEIRRVNEAVVLDRRLS